MKHAEMSASFSFDLLQEEADKLLGEVRAGTFKQPSLDIDLPTYQLNRNAISIVQ